MSKISQIPVKSVVDGSEFVPIYNPNPNSSFPADNYRVQLSALSAYYGSTSRVFAAAVDESASDVLSGSSSAEGDIVYLKNAGVFAKRVTIDVSGVPSVKYYKTFTDPNCHSGAPEAGKIYVCATPMSLYMMAGTAFMPITVPTVWLTEQEYEEATLIDGMTYITYENES